MHLSRLTFLMIAMCLMTACTKKDKQPKPTAHVDQKFSIDTNFDQEASILIINVNLPTGLHAYAVGEKIGKPIRLEISSTNGWRAAGNTEIPVGRIKKIAGLGESMVIEGPFVIKQKVVRGTGKGEARLHLQVCSETACDRPRTHILEINPN